ncbi:hypothetical protein OF829_04550 [Sphingomonas sp. LB-2]|uniref:hypothetical protein n=1 Tax=Sphingomonas caeni TaxID=2984949 RepID=UPI002232A66D|nr:hypothetical protein [Sphingomonas caeni]MCW3846497.1 hypothetical protein [Sphingomonas caeni]
MNEGAFLVSILVGPTVPIPLPRVALEALEEIEVTQTTEGESGFSLKFSIDTHSVLHTLLLVGGQQVPALRVIVVVTIGGLPQVLMDGVIDKQEMSGGGSGAAMLTVLGKDLTSVMNRIDKTGLPYPAMPVPARVLACLATYAPYGMIPVAIPPIFPVTKSPTTEIPKHKGTDLAYIRQMAAEAGYVFYVEPGPVPGTNTAYFGPEIRVGIPQRALNINSDGFTNVLSAEFGIDAAQHELPVMIVQEPFSKVSIPIPVPDISLANPPLGLVPPRLTGIRVLDDLGSLSAPEVMLRGLAASAKSADAVTATGTLDPVRYGGLLRSRGLVGMRGAGMAFDGLYFVKSVTTSIKAGALTQRFALVRNGLVSTVPAVAA